MILLWGISEDDPIRLVAHALRDAGIPYHFLDHRRILDTEVELTFGPDPSGSIRCGGQTIDLGDVRAAYFRPYDCRKYPGVGDRVQDRQGEAFRHVCETEDRLWSWAELASIRVLNRPTPMLSNNSKPFQGELIRAAGLATPDTLLTTCPDGARAFAHQHRAPIYKSISGVRSIVHRLKDPEHGRLDRLAWCPTQFQAYIPGVNYRVHVVGQQVFPTRIASEADDYRYQPARLEACTLPPRIQRKCLTLSRALELPLCGIDFKRTPEDEWVCFEVNPSPAFSYYQQGTGQPIAEAVAGYLAARDLSPGPSPTGVGEGS